MRATEFITELRKNPEQNPKIGVHKPLQDRVEKENTQVYVSFTDIEKLGFNPKNEYATPYAIYAYFADDVLGADEGYEFDGDANSLPYAGDRDYANIFTAPGANILHLEDDIHPNFDSVIDGAYKTFTRLYREKLNGLPSEDVRASIDKSIDEKRAGGHGESYIIYRVFEYLAELISNKSTAQTPAGHPGGVWTKLFLEAGWDAIYLHLDDDEVESASYFRQVGIFNQSKIEGVERLHNKHGSDTLDANRKYGAKQSANFRAAGAATTDDQRKKFLDTHGDDAIKYIRNPSKELQDYANALKVDSKYNHIKGRIDSCKDDEGLAHLIRHYGEEIVQYIKNPSEDIQRYVVRRNPAVIKYIKNPTPGIAAMAQELSAPAPEENDESN